MDYSSSAAAIALLAGVAAIYLGVYFFPVIVAAWRGHPNTLAIGLLTLLLGWSFVGWVVALVWAFTEVRSSSSVARKGEQPSATSTASLVRVAVGGVLILGLTLGMGVLALGMLFVRTPMHVPEPEFRWQPSREDLELEKLRDDHKSVNAEIEKAQRHIAELQVQDARPRTAEAAARDAMLSVRTEQLAVLMRQKEELQTMIAEEETAIALGHAASGHGSADHTINRKATSSLHESLEKLKAQLDQQDIQLELESQP